MRAGFREIAAGSIFNPHFTALPNSQFSAMLDRQTGIWNRGPGGRGPGRVGFGLRQLLQQRSQGEKILFEDVAARARLHRRHAHPFVVVLGHDDDRG
jgi:hypothetical protein